MDTGTKIHQALKDFHARRRQAEMDAITGVTGYEPLNPETFGKQAEPARPFTPEPEYSVKREFYNGRRWYSVFVKYPRTPAYRIAMCSHKEGEYGADGLLERLRNGTVNGAPGEDCPY